MHSNIAVVLTLASTAVAVPALRVRQTLVGNFELHANNTNIDEWAIINVDNGAGQSIIEIQRPSAYESAVSYLNSTSLEAQSQGKSKLAFLEMGTSQDPYEVALPDVPKGRAGLVVNLPLNGSAAFSIDGGVLHTHDGGPNGFYSCGMEVNGVETLTLWYGVDVEPQNLPDSSCQAIILTITGAS